MKLLDRLLRRDRDPEQTHRSPRWAFLSKMRIVDPITGELYLTRLRIVECPRFGVYLHRIATPDKARDLHDHPWDFVSIVLRGGYVEERLVYTHVQEPIDPTCRRLVYRTSVTVRVRRINRKRATDAHRIDTLARTPTWTLVIRGRREREWGFHTGRGWVHWKDYERLGELG